MVLEFHIGQYELEEKTHYVVGSWNEIQDQFSVLYYRNDFSFIDGFLQSLTYFENRKDIKIKNGGNLSYENPTPWNVKIQPIQGKELEYIKSHYFGLTIE